MDDIESLFGLKKWRRLPERSAEASRGAGRTRSAGDLKARILRHLISFPDLAREFNAQIAAESLESIEPIDRQIAEVWRAATGGAGTSSGALLELLADSEFAQTYRGLAALDLSVSEDAAAAHADLAAGFATLELRRVELELAALVQGTLDDQTKLRIRELSERRISLKAMPRGSGPADG
jgi:hypothetical protein